MPQYILPRDGEVDNVPLPGTTGSGLALEWDDLDAFTQGYIQALFFTNTGSGNSEEWATPEYQHRMKEGQTDGELPNDVGFADLDPDTLADIMRDCADFQRDNAALLEQAYAMDRPGNSLAYGPESAGMDFWYDRVGHGVGFWDRDLGDIGDALSEACGNADINPFFQDGKVYLEG